MVLFIVAASCNPATTATDRAFGKVYGAVAQSFDRQFSPLVSWLFGLFFDSFIASSYAQMKAAGWMFALIVGLLLPLGCSLISAGIGHPIFMIGGAPGGFKSTVQAFGIHRLACDGATLFLLLMAMVLPMQPATAGSFLFVFMPIIRVGGIITLWVLLARAHNFGALRIIFLGLPNILLVSVFSGGLSLVMAIYFYFYLVARSF